MLSAILFRKTLCLVSTNQSFLVCTTPQEPSLFYVKDLGMFFCFIVLYSSTGSGKIFSTLSHITFPIMNGSDTDTDRVDTKFIIKRITNSLWCVSAALQSLFFFFLRLSKVMNILSDNKIHALSSTNISLSLSFITSCVHTLLWRLRDTESFVWTLVLFKKIKLSV